MKITIEVADLKSTKQAARYLGVSIMTIGRWSKDGTLIPIKLNYTYFHVDELDRVKKNMEQIKKAMTEES